MKRTRLKSVSPRRAQKRQAARERYMDGFGVYFDEVPGLLGPVASWPKVRIVDNERVRWAFIAGRRCAWCLQADADAPHHVTTPAATALGLGGLGAGRLPIDEKDS